MLFCRKMDLLIFPLSGYLYYKRINMRMQLFAVMVVIVINKNIRNFESVLLFYY